METEKSKAVIVGLVAGQKIQPHPGGLALFHFLEGSGQVIIDEEYFAIQAGATVAIPDGARRGIEAETQLVFIAVHMP